MNRSIALLLLASVITPAIFAQEVYHGTAQIAYLKVRNSDGTYTTIRDVGTIPIKITPIDATVGTDTLDIHNLPSTLGLTKGGGGGFLGVSGYQTVYQNDTGSYFVAIDGASCLDDTVHTAAGNGKAWSIVKFGVHISDDRRTGKFLLRWRGYATYTGQLGPGVSAFSNEFFDSGFYVERNQFPATPPGQSTFLVEGDISQYPVFIVPNQTCYMASQFRTPHPLGPQFEDGEGPFTLDWNVFANNGPQIGTSQDMFWYDVPADGVYDETEVDMFDPEDGGVGAGNFAFKAQVNSGPTNVVNPFSFNWFRGTHMSGNVGSLWFDDGNYNVGRSGATPIVTEAPAQIVVESFSPTNFPTALRIDAQAKVNTVNLGMRVELWNFTTSQWVQVASGSVGTSDTTLIGFASNPGQCVQAGTSTIRAKVSFYRIGATPVFVWLASVDRIVWTITSP